MIEELQKLIISMTMHYMLFEIQKHPSRDVKGGAHTYSQAIELTCSCIAS